MSSAKAARIGDHADETAAGRRIEIPVPGSGSERFRLELELRGERVRGAVVEPRPSGDRFDEACRSRPWYQVLPLLERAFTGSGSMAALALCQAVEQLSSIEVPERAQWSRVLICETTRVSDHLGRLSGVCVAMGASMQAAWSDSAREIVDGWVQRIAGSVVVPHFVRLGGVSHALSAGLVEHVRVSTKSVSSILRDVDSTLGRSASFVDRLRGVAALDRDRCRAFGMTGFLLRASGAPSDLRRTPGYSVYPEIDFDIAVGSVGDNYDRFLVCLEEIKQSVRIVERCIAQLAMLGDGPVIADGPPISWPSRGRRVRDLSEMIRHATAVTNGPRVPAGTAFSAVEAANGELALEVVSDGSAKPVHIGIPVWGGFDRQAIPPLLVDVDLSDVPATLALCRAETTRWVG